MYIRWQERKRPKPAHWHGENPTKLVACLVENKRIDGKPKLHIICYLASIEVGKASAVARYRFYQSIHNKLLIRQFDAPTMEEIDAMLNKRVPMPTKEEVQDEEEANRAFLASIYTRTPPPIIPSVL